MRTKTAPISAPQTSQYTCESCPLLHSGVFHNISSDDRQVLQREKTINEYKRGNMLFYEGNYTPGAYCVLTGHVKLYKTAPGGLRHILQIASTGDVIGHVALLRGERLAASAEAMDDSVVCFIPKHVFIPLIQKNTASLLNLTQLVCRDLLQTRQDITELTEGPVQRRLAALLLHLKDKFARSSRGQGYSIDLNLSRREMAEMIGTTVETTIRLLNRFKRQGILEFQGRAILIKNIAELEALNCLEKIASPS